MEYLPGRKYYRNVSPRTLLKCEEARHALKEWMKRRQIKKKGILRGFKPNQKISLGEQKGRVMEASR